MSLKMDQQYTSSNTAPNHTVPNHAALFSHVFSAAFLQLDQIRYEHETMLASDKMMNHKLKFIAGVLKQLSIADETVPGSLAELIAVQIMKSANYARDMAEEEQRIIAESHNESAGNEEAEAAEYFVLSDQLNHCAKTLRHNLAREYRI